MRVTEFVICDDIRQEADGKVSLMGVLQSEMTVLVDPQAKGSVILRLAAYIAIDLDKGDDPAGFELTIKRDTESLMCAAGGFIVQPGSKRIQIAIGGQAIKLNEPSTVVLSLIVRDRGGAEILQQQRSISLAFAPGANIAKSAKSA